MMPGKWTGVLLLAGMAVFNGCQRAPVPEDRPGGLAGPGRDRRLEPIAVSADTRGFVLSRSGTAFVPWGFNYDRDFRMRLLEDYWEAEWSTVVEDFAEMKNLGANVVRIHLQFARFMRSPTKSDRAALAKLVRLLALAERNGLYLDITGLACYRKSQVPGWYAVLAEHDRWRAQARFWEAVASCCAESPAVFCYDLANEPIVPREDCAPGDWLVGELAGFVYCQRITLSSTGRSRDTIASEWIRAMTAAIRRHDRRHLITVGLLPDATGAGSGFAPNRVSRELDFLSVHLYPRTGKLSEDLRLLRSFSQGKPALVEEIFPLACQPEQLREFIQAGAKDAAGWIGFYWGQTPAQLTTSTNLGDALTAGWLRVFQDLRPGSRSSTPPAGE